ncbi:MAG TPA: LuxR C-terminal-related transcriptional regulator, partial [Hanamia sp.]
TLTKRQEDCLFYLAQGFTIKKIAHTLSLSPRTIEHYLENIKVKLNCYSRDELIQHAFRSTYFQEKIKSFK